MKKWLSFLVVFVLVFAVFSSVLAMNPKQLALGIQDEPKLTVIVRNYFVGGPSATIQVTASSDVGDKHLNWRVHFPKSMMTYSAIRGPWDRVYDDEEYYLYDWIDIGKPGTSDTVVFKVVFQPGIDVTNLDTTIVQVTTPYGEVVPIQDLITYDCTMPKADQPPDCVTP